MRVQSIFTAGCIVIFGLSLCAQQNKLDSYVEYSILPDGTTILDWIYTYTHDSLGRRTSQTVLVNPLEEPLRDSSDLKLMMYSEMRYFNDKALTATTLYSPDSGNPHPTSYELSDYTPEDKLRSQKRFELNEEGDTTEMQFSLFDPGEERLIRSEGFVQGRMFPKVQRGVRISRNTFQRINYRYDREGFLILKTLDVTRGKKSLQINYQRRHPNDWVEESRYEHRTGKRKGCWRTTLHLKKIRNKQYITYNSYGHETSRKFFLWNYSTRKWELKNVSSTHYEYSRDGLMLTKTQNLEDRIRRIEYHYK